MQLHWLLGEPSLPLKLIHISCQACCMTVQSSTMVFFKVYASIDMCFGTIRKEFWNLAYTEITLELETEKCSSHVTTLVEAHLRPRCSVRRGCMYVIIAPPLERVAAINVRLPGGFSFTQTITPAVSFRIPSKIPKASFILVSSPSISMKAQ